jgi:hypothetical protein
MPRIWEVHPISSPEEEGGSRRRQATAQARRAELAARQGAPGLPDPEEIVAERSFVSPKGKRYRVLRTNERDAYENDNGLKRKKE